LIADHSQRLTTGRWEQAVNRAQERVNMLPLEDKLALALHGFAAVTAEDFRPSASCCSARSWRPSLGAGRGGGLYYFQSQTHNQWNLLLTSILFITIPMLIMYIFFNGRSWRA
jgi:hypothetical protein